MRRVYLAAAAGSMLLSLCVSVAALGWPAGRGFLAWLAAVLFGIALTALLFFVLDDFPEGADGEG